MIRNLLLAPILALALPFAAHAEDPVRLKILTMNRKRRLRPIGFSFAFSGFGSWTEADELVGESRMSSL